MVQDKETIITKTPCGCVRALSKEAYKQAYGKEPSDDGIEPCSFELPHGGTMQAFKVPDITVSTALGIGACILHHIIALRVTGSDIDRYVIQSVLLTHQFIQNCFKFCHFSCSITHYSCSCFKKYLQIHTYHMLHTKTVA